MSDFLSFLINCPVILVGFQQVPCVAPWKGRLSRVVSIFFLFALYIPSDIRQCDVVYFVFSRLNYSAHVSLKVMLINFFFFWGGGYKVLMKLKYSDTSKQSRQIKRSRRRKFKQGRFEFSLEHLDAIKESNY